jgi:hypothetical protein
MVSASKILGDPSGSFQVDVKPSRAAASLFQRLDGDDWIDISFGRHGQYWHVFRGLIKDLRRSQTVNGRGATVESFTISGEDFGSIWMNSPIWFSPYANDMVTEAVCAKIFDFKPAIRGAPNEAVKGYLKGFLEELRSNKGPNWNPPNSMPGIVEGSFLKSVSFWDDAGAGGFQNLPKRQAFNPNFGNEDAQLWQLAIEHSDPLFVEVFTELFAEGSPVGSKTQKGDPLSPKDSKMTVVIRDRPFPVVDPEIAAIGYKASWDKLPVFVISPQQIVSRELVRSERERFNAYFVSSLLQQEVAGPYALSLMAPLIHEKSMQRHGLRRMDIQTLQVPVDLRFDRLAEVQRRILRDFYCMNPYFLSGTIDLAIGRPEIKLGTRVRVLPMRVDEPEENFYVESWTHRWQFGQGIRTSLGVTRGWLGDDRDYLGCLQEESKNYRVPTFLGTFGV